MRRIAPAAILITMVVIAWWLHAIPPPVSIFDNRPISREGRTWAVIGSAYSPDEAFVDMTGAFQPGLHRHSINYFIYDRAARRLYRANPNETRRSLVGDFLPAPRVSWQRGGLSCEMITFVTDSDICLSSITLKNRSGQLRRISFFAAALPQSIPGGLNGSVEMSYDRGTRSILAGGEVLLACDSKPDSFGFTDRSRRPDRKFSDVTGYIRRGALPRSRQAEPKPGQYASGAVKYDLDLKPGESRTLIFRSPISPVGPEKWAANRCARIAFSQAMRTFRNRWSRELGRVRISVPDKRYADCFHASLAYLMILSDSGLPRPGAAHYLPFWVRDYAYIADALYYAGRSDLIEPGLDQIRALQLPNGGFACRTGTGSDEEYDSPGQAIYALVQHYRRTGDRKWLLEVWPTLQAACKYIRSKRLENGLLDPARSGMLPPSMSAEDLGRPNQQHYWDDFWSIRGLRDAAFAAHEVGRKDDAAWIEEEARKLLDATWASIRAVTRERSISYIPNGPEEVTSSAMARGTSCALWPCDVLDPKSPFVRSSFDEYWKKWIASHGGGFEHKGEFWPYAGLDLAQCYLMLKEFDRVGEILRWTLNHDPTRGLFSWPEGMEKSGLGLAAGDMPHGWMCASYISLLRNILARESGGELLLASGVPREWLAPGREISVANLPTLYGKLTYRLRSTGDTLKLSIGRGAKPPGGFRVIVPRGKWRLRIDNTPRDT